jgi:hypothetical protein
MALSAMTTIQHHFLSCREQAGLSFARCMQA